MKHTLPPLTQDLIDAFTASAVAWVMRLMRVIARLGVFNRNRRLNRLVSHLEHDVECTLFLKAMHRARLRTTARRHGPVGPARRPTRQPLSAPAGFRRCKRLRKRLFYRNANIRARKADLGARLAALDSALANPEPHIAYFLRRILRGLRVTQLIAFAPPAHALSPDAPPHAVFTDSS